MSRIKQNLIYLSFMLIIPVLNIFYVLLNNPKHEVSSLITHFDQAIPFMKIFVIPYLFWYPFVLITMFYLCMKDREIYIKTILTYALGLITCYMTYLVFQTTVPRPVLIGDDILIKMLQFVYHSDQPYNCFPSIHVLSSYLMIKAIHKSAIKNWKNQSVIVVNSILIILSTFFVKQHVILDAVSGILVAEFLYRLVDLYYSSDRILIWKKRSNSLLPYTRSLRINKDFEM